MKAKELIKILETDPERIIVLSRDQEGNGYQELAATSQNYRFKDGDIGIEKLTPELKEDGYSQEDVMRDGKKCFVLWP